MTEATAGAALPPPFDHAERHIWSGRAGHRAAQQRGRPSVEIVHSAIVTSSPYRKSLRVA
ncbi:hypothetical protein G3M53_92390 [Streptomyces sp. SID7982]|nr:hypothetical protein [Streptomyces sp. SID7982]